MEGVGGGGGWLGVKKQTGRADHNTKVEEKYNGERRRRRRRRRGRGAAAAEEADRALRSARRHTRAPLPAPAHQLTDVSTKIY